jgi:hypothetical protein
MFPLLGIYLILTVNYRQLSGEISLFLKKIRRMEARDERQGKLG